MGEGVWEKKNKSPIKWPPLPPKPPLGFWGGKIGVGGSLFWEKNGKEKIKKPPPTKKIIYGLKNTKNNQKPKNFFKKKNFLENSDRLKIIFISLGKETFSGDTPGVWISQETKVC